MEITISQAYSNALLHVKRAETELKDAKAWLAVEKKKLDNDASAIAAEYSVVAGQEVSYVGMKWMVERVYVKEIIMDAKTMYLIYVHIIRGKGKTWKTSETLPLKYILKHP